jgi:hypothetical protein
MTGSVQGSVAPGILMNQLLTNQVAMFAVLISAAQQNRRKDATQMLDLIPIIS